APGNRDAAGGAQDRIEDPVPVHAFIDDEPDRSRTSERENDRIDPGDVVRHKEEPAGRQAIEAARGDPIKNRRKGKTDKTYEPFCAGELRHNYGLQGAPSSVQSAIR